jgi:type II secretory pathway predicted ATPase ExeA
VYQVKYDEDVIRTAALAGIERQVKRAADSPGSMLAIIGPCGAGKSTAMRGALERLGAGYRIIAVDTPQKEELGTGAVMDCIIEELGEPPRRYQRAKAEQFKRLVGEATGSGRRLVVVIDEAHSIPLSTLKSMKRMLEFTFALRRALFSCILCGQSELRGRLRKAPEVNKRTRRVEMASLREAEGKMLVAAVAKHEGLALDADAVTEVARRAVLPLDLVQVVTELAQWAEEHAVSRMDLGTVMHALGETQRALMAEYGITVADVARETGVAKSTVSEALTGKYPGRRHVVEEVNVGLNRLVERARKKKGDGKAENVLDEIEAGARG